MSKNFNLLNGSVSESLLEPPHIVPTKIGTNTQASLLRVEEADDEHIDWQDALRAIARHWKSSLIVAVAVPLLVTIAVFIIKPTYIPTAQIEVDPPGNEQFSLTPASPFDSASYADTEVNNLKSNELAVAVIRKLRLDRNAEFTKVEPRMPSGTEHSNSSELILTPAEHFALRHFGRSLTVQRDPTSWLIRVSFAAHDPGLAALITNTIVEQYIETKYRTRHEAVLLSTEWLSHQLDDIRSRMKASNQALTDFQKSSGIAPTGNAQSTFDEHIAELNRQLTIAQADRIQLEALLGKNAIGDDILPQMTADPVVQDLSKKLLTARAELKEALVIQGKNHPKTKQLEELIAELQVQLQHQQDTIFSTLSVSFAAAHTKETLLRSELIKANREVSQMAQYAALKKEAETNESLYNTLFTKIKEAGIAAESKSSNVRWVDRAQVLYFPTQPFRLLDICLGILAGVVGGIIFACVQEALDSKVHNLEDVKIASGIARISVIPLMTANVPTQRTKLASEAGREIFLLTNPESPESEALLGLVTSIRVSHLSRSAQVFLITSAVAAEGKTTIAANLSVALARHCSTCIVDADLRKCRVGALFGIGSEYGLTDVLSGKRELQEALTALPTVPNLTLLPAGSAVEHVGKLICSDAMRELISGLRNQFQAIVIDSPPVLPYADARALSSLTDQVIFVGRSGVTTREAVRRGLEVLEQAHSAPVTDVVLNACDTRSWEYEYSYGYQHK
jgi:succinoglycan biosynthesis transport protein ExoP